MTRRASLIAFLLASLGWVAGAAAQQSEFTHGPHMWGDGWHGGFFGPIMMILFVALAVAAVVLIVRWLGPVAQSHSAPPGAGPLDILKTRFAKGEIDKSEYEERRRVLEP